MQILKFDVTFVKPMSRKVFSNEALIAIGQRIREARGKERQSDFAAKLNVSRSVLSNYEAGRRLPDSAVIELIEHFGAQPSGYVLTGVDVTADVSVISREVISEETWYKDSPRAVVLHLYERLRAKVFYSDNETTQLWWGKALGPLESHFEDVVFRIAEAGDLDSDLAARIAMRRIDKTDESKLLELVESLHPG